MAIKFDPEHDPVSNGHVNLDTLRRHVSDGCKMAGLMPGALISDPYAEPVRTDPNAVVNSPALTRLHGLDF